MKIVLSNMAAVDIIIPFYKREVTIARAIESIVCQIFAGLQEIIPNDSTTGNGIKVASQFFDLGIRIIEQDNRDVPVARNHRK